MNSMREPPKHHHHPVVVGCSKGISPTCPHFNFNFNFNFFSQIIFLKWQVSRWVIWWHKSGKMFRFKLNSAHNGQVAIWTGTWQLDSELIVCRLWLEMMSLMRDGSSQIHSILTSLGFTKEGSKGHLFIFFFTSVAATYMYRGKLLLKHLWI